MASNVVMFLVVVMVFAGLSFSGYQLWKAVNPVSVQRARRRRSTAEAISPEPSVGVSAPSKDIQFSAKEIRITSSVVGIVVLVISLAFAYLFITDVYKINQPPEYSIQNPSSEKLPEPNK